MMKAAAFFLIVCCGLGCTSQPAAKPQTPTPVYLPPAPAAAGEADYDAVKGEGRFTDFKMSDHPDRAKAQSGATVYALKCRSCHKLSEEKLVGPGLKGITARREDAWILNFITNTDVMLKKDPRARAQQEICMVKMPNPNLTDTEATDVLEFMRANDQKK